MGIVGKRVARARIPMAHGFPRRPMLGWRVAEQTPDAAQPVEPGQRFQPQEMVQGRVGQRCAARIVAIRQHHDPAAVVGQQTQIAIVAGPTPAVVDAPGAAVVYDIEAEAVVPVPHFREFRAVDVDLRCHQLGSRGGR